MKILKENNVKLSKRLTESTVVDENKSIGKMVSDILFSPICDYFNSKYGDLGFEFIPSHNAEIVIKNKNKERKIPPFIILENGDDYGEYVLTLYTIIKGQHGIKPIKASSLSEMCKLLEDYIIR